MLSLGITRGAHNIEIDRPIENDIIFNFLAEAFYYYQSSLWSFKNLKVRMPSSDLRGLQLQNMIVKWSYDEIFRYTETAQRSVVWAEKVWNNCRCFSKTDSAVYILCYFFDSDDFGFVNIVFRSFDSRWFLCITGYIHLT